MSDSLVSVPEISVVVPVWRDAAALGGLLAHRRDPRDEWIVVNGDREDTELARLGVAHPDVVWLDSAPGRGLQLATGAACARGAWVLFLHADTRLGAGWREEVTRAAATASYDWGCFRLAIDTRAWQARLIEQAVVWRVRWLRLPYGDQAMFFRRERLEALGGVPRLPVMEDVALARLFGRFGPPWQSDVPARTSARRWERDGWWRRTLRNWWLLIRYLLGVSPERLAPAYLPDAAARDASPGPDKC